MSRQESISIQTQLTFGVPVYSVGGVPAHSEQVGDSSSPSFNDVISAGTQGLP